MGIHSESADDKICLITLQGSLFAVEKSDRVGLISGQLDSPHRLGNDLGSSVLSPAQQKIIEADDPGKMGITGSIAAEDGRDGVFRVFGAGKAQCVSLGMERVSLDAVDDSFFRQRETFFAELFFKASGDHASAEIASTGPAFEEVFAVKDNKGYGYPFFVGPFSGQVGEEGAGRTSADDGNL
jgi:hypothetical protein